MLYEPCDQLELFAEARNLYRLERDGPQIDVPAIQSKYVLFLFPFIIRR